MKEISPQQLKQYLQKEFFPTCDFGKLGLAVARKAITEYQKVSDSIPDLADLMLFNEIYHEHFGKSE